MFQILTVKPLSTSKRLVQKNPAKHLRYNVLVKILKTESLTGVRILGFENMLDRVLNMPLPVIILEIFQRGHAI